MISYGLIITGSYSIAVGVAIGLYRFKKIHHTYRPFILIILASLLNEVCSTICINLHESNAVSTNIFGLVEGMLWLLQFRKWKALNKYYWLHPVAVFVLVAAWTFENIILGKLFTFSSGYGIVLSFMLVFLSINTLNRQIVEERNSLFKNAIFLVCLGNVIFYTYRVLVESFYVMQLENSGRFLANIFGILVFVNLFVNLLFAFATIWIPTRQRFSLPYS